MKNVFDAASEKTCDVEGERKARIIAAGLDCINCLARNTQAIRQLSLTPVTLGSENPEIVLHW